MAQPLSLTVVLVSGYVVQRGISQELRVARLQSDFVAAVSRASFARRLPRFAPSLNWLAQNRITDETRRQQSYVFLDHETNRLHRLVEDLLDFGRMESGRKQYRMETYDAFRKLVRAAVSDIHDQATANGFLVETELDSSPRLHSLLMRRALSASTRNLLENAMKYSPICRTVWVDGSVNGGQVLVSVRDEGMGIDGPEKQLIFQKFVRGSAAKKAGIKGTGIGPRHGAADLPAGTGRRDPAAKARLVSRQYIHACAAVGQRLRADD